jgi:perosamine synthetase
MLEKYICNNDFLLIDALEKIIKNGKGTLFIIDNNILKGIIDYAGLREKILEDKMLGSKLGDLELELVFVKDLKNLKELPEKILKRYKIIPIVDESLHIVDYVETNIFTPIATPHLTGNEFKYLLDAFSSTWISSTGFYIDKFEKNFAAFCESEYAIATSNGTVAIQLALSALDIGKGDQVIVPDFTFAATINAVINTGAEPVIVDVEKDSWCINPDEMARAITVKTKAIIPVHIYGQPANMEKIMQIARENNLYVVEDCAEAHGAKYKSKKVGSWGDIGCFSFYANKVITTGEGGMCVTDSEELNKKMRMLRDHGMNTRKKYWHDFVGFNFRMTNLQAAIGCAQLEKIEYFLEKRRLIENRYKQTLKEFDFLKFQNDQLTYRDKITWLVSALIKADMRDHIIEVLNDNGINARPFFHPLSKMDIYKRYVFSCENSQKIAYSGINFPTYIGLNEKVFGKIKEIFNGVISEIIK